MLDLALKNISRQRTRTILTVLGIVIGIAAVVALGSFSEGINRFITGSLELSAGKIMVQQKGSGGFQSGFSGSDITDNQIEELKNIDGVKDVIPMNIYFETGGGGGIGFGGPSLVIAGVDPEKSDLLVGENVRMKEGRELAADDRDMAMVGYNLAEERKFSVGDDITVKDMGFEIIGIIEKTDNANVDGVAVVNIKDVQELMKVDTYQILYVVPFDVRDSERISEEIVKEDENLEAITAKDLARQASQIVSQIRIFTFGIGGIAAVVGGLGVLNTMIMAVLERKREIGVMKAIGATKKKILMQILTESMIISLVGGLAGLFFGFVASFGLNLVTANSFAVVTPELATGGILFALALGFIGGVYPAMKAANLDPVEALRYE